MTIRHLKIFIAIVDSGSMTAAAKKLFITQPSVSQAIMEIENYYNIKLFERLSRRLYITNVGKEFLNYARHIISLFDEMEKKMKGSMENATLKIGASMTIGACLLSEISRMFLINNPNISIESIVDNTMVIEEKVLKNKVDFALVEGPIHDKNIMSNPFMNDELILICGSNHPYKDRKYITMDELARMELVLRESGSGTRELFENIMLSKGYSLNIKWVCNNSEAIKNAVISNMGGSVISRLAVDDELRAGKLYAIKVKGLELKRKFNIIYHKNKYISKPIKNFWSLCFQLYK